MKPNKNILSWDYIYVSDETSEFLNVNISVAVEEDGALVTLVPDHAMSEAEINKLLVEVEADMIKKARTSLLNDCRVVLSQDNKKINITLEKDRPAVKGMDTID